MKTVILTIEIHTEPDVVLARQRARFLAELLGFDLQDQTRIATAVSEIARNAFQYAERGRAQFSVERGDDGDVFWVRVSDHGAGIANVAEVLEGPYRSKTGMGIGLRGAKKLMDEFRIETSSGGTTIELGKRRPSRLTGHSLDLARITARLAAQATRSPFEEVRQQNQELLRALEDLKAREEELTRVNRELAETNTGVAALYAELEARADALRGSMALKARFHSQMSHEIRTPINSISSISELLLNGTVVDPLPEQQKPLGFIRTAAQELSELVNDLLDLAKVEAGKMSVHPTTVSVQDLFGGLRGMFRSLHRNEAITLVFEDVAHLPALWTDEGKVGQVLRNFISNALKFTEHGEVRVSATCDRDQVTFSVSDTGIGISAEDQDRLFREFSQIENAKQRTVIGTGLGLALARDLAELLEGSVSVTSAAGTGSVFRLAIPRALAGAEPEPRSVADPRIPVVIVADHADTFRAYDQHLPSARFNVRSASISTIADQLVEAGHAPAPVVVFDGHQLDDHSWRLLEELRSDARTRALPTLLVSIVGHGVGARGSAAEREWLLGMIQSRDGATGPGCVLIIDGDAAVRDALPSAAGDVPFVVIDGEQVAATLPEGRARVPRVIFLDSAQPATERLDLLARLKADPKTCEIPIVVDGSRGLATDERERLASLTAAILTTQPRAHP